MSEYGFTKKGECPHGKTKPHYWVDLLNTDQYCGGPLMTAEEWRATIDYEAAEIAYSNHETSKGVVDAALGGNK